MQSRADMVEVCDTQNTIIRLQSDVIDGLFRHLCLLLTAEELDAIPEIEKINTAAQLRVGIGWEVGSDG